jgi:hypothetical protein
VYSNLRALTFTFESTEKERFLSSQRSHRQLSIFERAISFTLLLFVTQSLRERSLLPYWKDNLGCPCRWVSDDIWRYGRIRMWWFDTSVPLTHPSPAISSVHKINESGYITDLLSEIVEVCMFTWWVNIKSKTICKSVLIWNRSGNFELGLISIACIKHSRCKARFHSKVL